jgi:hypothetical protein
VLVIAGNHGQFTDWLHLVYGRDRTPGTPPRYVHDADGLFGYQAEDIDAFHQVGEYWLHPAWGSDVYCDLMDAGVQAGKPWAMDWVGDWRRAQALRDPVTPEEMEQARVGLTRLERELADGD